MFPGAKRMLLAGRIDLKERTLYVSRRKANLFGRLNRPKGVHFMKLCREYKKETREFFIFKYMAKFR